MHFCPQRRAEEDERLDTPNLSAIFDSFSVIRLHNEDAHQTCMMLANVGLKVNMDVIKELSQKHRAAPNHTCQNRQTNRRRIA